VSIRRSIDARQIRAQTKQGKAIHNGATNKLEHGNTPKTQINSCAGMKSLGIHAVSRVPSYPILRFDATYYVAHRRIMESVDSLRGREV
jgi:hypothetical protein